MKILARLLALAGLLALGYCAFEFGKARLFQIRQAEHFVEERAIEPAPASPAAPHPPAVSDGSPVAVLKVPRLGLSVVVVEGAEKAELKLAAGHVRGTPLAGSGGNFAVAGHRDTFFRPLRQIRRNDTILVETHRQQFQYKVVSTEIVDPGAVGVLRPAGHETLTLITCYPFYFVGAAPNRFIVHADCTNCVVAGES
jgi:sortase A